MSAAKQIVDMKSKEASMLVLSSINPAIRLSKRIQRGTWKRTGSEFMAKHRTDKERKVGQQFVVLHGREQILDRGGKRKVKSKRHEKEILFR